MKDCHDKNCMYAGYMHQCEGFEKNKRAFIITKFYMTYYLNGKLHREDGPANIGKNFNYWYINGKRIK